MSDLDKHALLSPSGAGKWMVCVGAPAMERGIPDTPSEYSDEGTCAHAVAAMCLTEGKPATAYVGRRIEVGVARTYEFCSDMAEPVQVYVNGVRETVEAYWAAGAAEVELHVEQRVPIGHITGEEGAEGTADVIILVHWTDETKTLHVRDLKFGSGVEVRAEKNPQLLAYALGAIHKHDPLDDVSGITISVHQPRISTAPDSWSCDIKTLTAFKHRMEDAAAEALAIYSGSMGSGPVGLRAGEHCRKNFCKARDKCHALAAYVQDTVGAEFDVLDKDAPEKRAHGEVSVPADATELAAKFKALGVIEDWCKQVRARAEALLFESYNSPEVIDLLGIKLVQGKRGDRAWASEEEAEKALKSFRLKQEQMYSFKLISPTKAEELLKKASPKRWNKLEPLITRAEGKPSVALANDKRPPLVLTPVIDQFDDITDDVEGLL